MAKRARARDPRDRVRGSVSCALARFALAFSSFENREKIMPVLQATALPRSTILAKRFGTPPLFHLVLYCMEFAANLRYTLINTALTRFFPHPPKQS